MWRSALAAFSTASAGQRVPALQKTALSAAATPSTKKSLKNVSTEMHASSGTFTSNAELLHTAEDDLAFVVSQAQLQSSLQRKPRLRRNLLVSSTQQATANEALHSVTALLNAGKTDDIAQIVLTWTSTTTAPKLSLRQKAAITKRLTRSIATVAQLRDATTLRNFLAIVANADATTQETSTTLFGMLGRKRVKLVKMQATLALCQLAEADGVSLMEKLYWIEQCASPTTVLGREQLLVPFSLYTILREVTESDNAQGAAAEDVHQLAPDLLASAVSPFQADVAALVRLPRSELQKMRDAPECINVPFVPATAAAAAASSPASARFLQRVAATSKPLQLQERNAALVRAMTSHRALKRHLRGRSVSLKPSEIAARRELIRVLKGRHRGARHATTATRDVCRSVVMNPQLMATMNLSPTIVLACYLRAFHSIDTVNPVVAKTSAAVVPRLCARHLYETAAFVSWNHLSTSCDAVEKVFRKCPRLLDLCVGSMSRVMQKNIQTGTASKWMGHRSIALLRTAAKGTPVTPMHCIPVCASAVGVGVHYASVEEALRDIFPSDKATAAWTLDMIRLCVSKDDQTIRKPAKAYGMSQLLQTLMRNARNVMGGRSASLGIVPVTAPSRSKQLALWQTMRSSESQPVLKSLTRSLFANDAARRQLLDGSLLLQSDAVKADEATVTDNDEKPLEQLMTWEVLASIATNCTSETLYSEMVESLTNRQMGLQESFVSGRSQTHLLGDREKMRKLLLSEQDEEGRAGHAQSNA